MKASELREFAQELLTANGASVLVSSPHLLRVEVTSELADRIGRTELALAFNQRGLNEDPSSELATVGNPVFDRVLALAQERGRLGVRYIRSAAGPTGKAPSVPKLSQGLELGEPFDSYAPLYFHVFKVQYSVEETPDNLEVVAVDGITLEVQSQSPDLVDLWSGLDPEPTPGRRVPPSLPVPDPVIRAGMDGLERRLRRRLARLKRDATQHLAHEGESIGTYYQNLIEEARTSKRRLAGGLQAREDKIRILQLDWKRRMEEAQDFWRPKVDVELSGLGVVMRPSRQYEVRRSGKLVGSIHLPAGESGFLLPPAIGDGTVQGRS